MKEKKNVTEPLKEIGLEQLNKIPEQCTKLFIDVGLAIDAPNASAWLKKYPDAYVVGMEPNPENVAILKTGRTQPFHLFYLCLNENAVMYKGDAVCNIEDRFCLLETAIDNVDSPSYTSFYLTDERNTGCSSLLKPTDLLGLDVTSIHQTPVVDLKSILDNLLYDRFSHVTFLKTDCQGKDLDAVKSCKEYLKDILFIQMEVTTDGQYEGEQDPREIEQFMTSNGFVNILHGSRYDRIYFNEELSRTVEPFKVEYIVT